MITYLFFGLIIFFFIHTNVNTASFSSSKSKFKFNLFKGKPKKQAASNVKKFNPIVVWDKHASLIRALKADLPVTFLYTLNDHDNHTDDYEITIKRNDLIRDTFKKLMALRNDKKTPFALKRKLWILFEGENDSGNGLKTEWFGIFSTKTFHPEYGLFKFSNEKSDVVEIDPNARLNQKSLINQFELLGFFTAMAIYHTELLNVNFSVPFLKYFLNKSIELEDLEFAEPDYYGLFHKILKKNPAYMNLTFEVQHPRTEKMHYLDGVVKKPTAVTEANREKYIALFIMWKYKEVIKEEMEAFQRGFQILIPLDLMTKLKIDENELDAMISGEKTIDVGTWERSTKYFGCKNTIVEWFWKIVKSFDESTKSKLLQYVTGVNRIPVTRSFYFSLECTLLENENPIASTCNNRLYIGNHYKKIKDMKVVLIALTKFPLKFNRATGNRT